MGDLRATFDGGDAAALSYVGQDEKATTKEFRCKISLASSRHILKLFAPEKLAAISNIMDGIVALAEFNQQIGKHMVSFACF